MSDLHTDNRRFGAEQQQQLDDLDETAPLLLSHTRTQEFSVVESIAVEDVPLRDDDKTNPPPATDTSWPRSTMYLILLCTLLTSMSFGVTQVPLLEVFRLMTCDAYYAEHESPSQPDSLAQSTRSFAPTIRSVFSYALASVSDNYYITTTTMGNKIESGDDFDRCSIHAIQSATALSVSLLGASTTVFGIVNLFLTNSLIKRIGVKPTLLIQVFFPAIRLLIQNVGVEVWGSNGIIIIQCSQIVNIIGGPSGYMLVLNTFITEVVDHQARTAALGRLTGSMMLGAAFGFLIGGIVADVFGIKAPFRLTLVLFLASCAYVVTFLPNIPPAGNKVAHTGPISGEKRKKNGVVSNVFGPLVVFAPRKFIGRDGVVRTEYGAFLLAWGVFLGILATGYLPTLLQLYTTDVFGFGTKDNGGLIFMYSMLRGLFLALAFPKLIAMGRKWSIKKEEEEEEEEEEAFHHHARSGENPRSSEREPLLATQTPGGTATDAEAETVVDSTDKAHKQEQTYTFDLTYTRFSLVADGLLTLLCSFITEGWQVYLVAAVLPFAAGTSSAAKGTILQMVGSSASSDERADALAGVSLVENMARLSTTFFFGVVFAGFASIGRTELVFACNAAVALIGFGVLLFARFPPEGSSPLDSKQDQEEYTPAYSSASDSSSES